MFRRTKTQQPMKQKAGRVEAIGKPQAGILPLRVSFEGIQIPIAAPAELRGTVQTGDTLSFTINMAAVKSILKNPGQHKVYAIMQQLGGRMGLYRGQKFIGETWVMHQPKKW